MGQKTSKGEGIAVKKRSRSAPRSRAGKTRDHFTEDVNGNNDFVRENSQLSIGESFIINDHSSNNNLKQASNEDSDLNNNNNYQSTQNLNEKSHQNRDPIKNISKIDNKHKSNYINRDLHDVNGYHKSLHVNSTSKSPNSAELSRNKSVQNLNSNSSNALDTDPVRSGSKRRFLSSFRNSFRRANHASAASRLNCFGLHLDSTDLGDIPKKNYFAKLYKDNLHLLVFKHFSFDERLKLRGVCRLWRRDMFVNCEFFRYPCFRKVAENSYCTERIPRIKPSIVASMKLAHQCSQSMKIVEFTEPLSTELMTLFSRCCSAEQIREMHFLPTNLKFEIINEKQSYSFFKKFGSKLEYICVDPQTPCRKKNAEITEKIIFLTDFASSNLPLLKRISLKITEPQTVKYFKTFYSNSDFQKQFQDVDIELSFEDNYFEKGLCQVLDTLITFTKLTKLTMKLSPEVNHQIFKFNDLFVTINNTIEDFLPDVNLTVIVSDENMHDSIDPKQVQNQCQQTFGNNVGILFKNEKLFS